LVFDAPPEIHPVQQLRTLLRLPKVLDHIGESRSALYSNIQQGLFVKPVQVGGGYAVAWPADEVAAIINARIAGKSNEEIKTLVKVLEHARLSAALPADEVAAILHARVASKSDDEFKALVQALEQARRANA
jgi:prophage regulatory protein